jgi:hypothetical protein
MRQVRADLFRHVGGRPSATQTMMIERAVTLTAYLARLDAEALSPVSLSDHRRREYLAADGALRRTLREIGLEGTPAVERGLTLADYISTAPSLDFSNANVSGRRTRPSSAFQWYAGSGLLVIWRGSRHARAITFGFP